MSLGRANGLGRKRLWLRMRVHAGIGSGVKGRGSRQLEVEGHSASEQACMVKGGRRDAIGRGPETQPPAKRWKNCATFSIIRRKKEVGSGVAGGTTAGVTTSCGGRVTGVIG